MSHGTALEVLLKIRL